jgi:AraC-like DNA-binding protein
MACQRPRDIPARADTLGETLYSLRLNGAVYANSELTAPWGIEMPPMGGMMMFHIVTEGGCWLRFNDNESIYLKPGELAMIPRGEGHCIAHSEDQPCEPFFDIPVTKLSERLEYMRYGGSEDGTGEEGPGEETRLICGVLGFDHIAGQKLVSQLPQIIHIQCDDADLPCRPLQAMIELMEQEAASLAPGGETVMAQLADIIVIHAIRYWIEHAPEGSKGWLGALEDPKLGKALAAIHAHPETHWTVDRLAEQAGMSRSGFSARFTEVLGTSVKHYLTDWRMNLARMKILQSPVTLTELAQDLGYQSEAAFSRAYKRVFGVPPLRQKHDAT